MKDVVVVIIHQDHDECTVAYDMLEEMAFQFSNNYYLMFGFMEWKHNAVEGLFPPKFPSIYMFPGNRKNEKFFHFDQELTKLNLIKFIKEHTS